MRVNLMGFDEFAPSCNFAYDIFTELHRAYRPYFQGCTGPFLH